MLQSVLFQILKRLQINSVCELCLLILSEFVLEFEEVADGMFFFGFYLKYKSRKLQVFSISTQSV